MKDFYLTLPSNSSMSVFPNNTVSKFTTKLNQTIELKGDWEVSLTEIIFPMSFYNIRKGQNVLEYVKNEDGPNNIPSEAVTKKVKIPPGNYPSVEYLVDYINTNSSFKSALQLKYNEVTSHIEIKTTGEYSVFANEKLAEVLGFENGHALRGVGRAPTALYKQVPQQLFLYSDIIEPQLVGDTVAPLLRIVGIEQRSEFGKVIVKTYESPHYVSVLKRQFETIEIDLRDSLGNQIPFEYGPAIVKLHFKKCVVQF